MPGHWSSLTSCGNRQFSRTNCRTRNRRPYTHIREEDRIMRLVTFALEDNQHYIGALIDNGNSIVVLQQAAVAMDGKPHQFFSDILAFLRGGEMAVKKA